jgi:hypothetical protein
VSWELTRCQAGILTSIVYHLGLTFAKISILCLYIRILTYDHVRLAAKVLLGIVIITHMWIICSLLTVCVPLDAFWDFSKRKGAYCHPLTVFWSHAGLNISTDFLIFLLPLFVLHKLRISRRQKVAVYLVFLIGFWYALIHAFALSAFLFVSNRFLVLCSVCIVSILRCLNLARVGVTTKPDLTWDAISTANWTMIEVHAAVVCACLTTIKPVVVRMFPRLLSSHRDPHPADDGAIETVGRMRQKRRDPLETENTLSTLKSVHHVSTDGEAVMMTDLEAPEERGATRVEVVIEPEGLIPPGNASVRPEQSYDSLGRPAATGHSVI